MVSISEFLQQVKSAGELLERSIEEYLVSDYEKFSQSVKEIREIEHDADEILQKVKHDLYAYLLIPDTRSDVDALLNRLDDFIDDTKQLFVLLSLERPHIPESVVDQFRMISEKTFLSAETLFLVGDSYFTHPQEVPEKVKQVFICEKEVDRIQEEVVDEIYNGIPSLSLSQKMHVTRFLDLICILSDILEEIGKDLVISALKRSM